MNDVVRPTILHADDDPIIRMTIGRALKNTGIDTIEAADGREALALIREHRKRLSAILSDFQMGGNDANEQHALNGLTLMQNVMNDPELAHIPRVMLTGAEDTMRKIATARRIDLTNTRVIAKPILDFYAFAAMMKQVIDSRQQ
ncbi:MAG: response regulator [Candidatus Peribacteraceae bacterium]